MDSVMKDRPAESIMRSRSTESAVDICPWHLCVLIPARNEEQLLPRCLHSVLAAVAEVPAPNTCDLIVAVDSSTDRTVEVAEQLLRGRGRVVITNEGVVGSARAHAARAALERYDGPNSRCWLANTDADCIVRPEWLNQHLALAANHVEALAGIIDVDSFEGHDSIVEERFRATYIIPPDGSHSHVHGANLGVRADVYLKAGGWRDVGTGEDHDLWSRLTNIDARRYSTSRVTVLTSGRRVGRAPRGFADALAAHNESAA